MLTLRHLRILTLRTVKEFSDDNCTQMAAAISYYVLFSLFPLLIFSVGVLGFALQDSKLEDEFVEVVLDYIPSSQAEAEDDVAEAVHSVASTGSGALGLFGLLGMAWSGSNMFGIVRRSLNLAYDLELHRPLVRQKLLDLGLVLAFAPVFIASFAATAAIRFAQQSSENITVVPGASETAGLFWAVLPLLVPAAISFCAFVVLYWIVPATRVRLRDVWLGAATAAILFEISKVGFSIYLENFSNYNVVFGPLGAVVAFLFWIFISANILLLGAEIASEYPRVMRGDYDEQEKKAPRVKLTPVERARKFLIGLVWHEHERKQRAPRDDSQDG